MFHRRRQRGVSLVEALVAMLVMSFGTVAVLGVQASLRMNADVAKQRSEAVRLAEEALEDYRDFGTLADFEALADQDPEAVAGFESNTTFTRSVTVANGAMPRERVLTADVGWTDRRGEAHIVRLVSSVHGVPTELAGSLVVAADTSYARMPGQRHPGIPPGAQIQEDGTSRFTPPGATGVTWVFNNATGAITQICVDASCTDTDARLLAGFVVFATGLTQPTTNQAEVPPSPKPAGYTVEVQLAQTAPSTATIDCYEDQGSSAWVAYYCAVPLGVGTSWSGRSTVQGLPLASDLGDDHDDKYRVCRYTPVRNNGAVTPPTFTNVHHPYNYLNVSTALVQQNFLVIRAGDDSNAFDCPDDTDDDLVLGRTWRHQPAS